jgi:beta-lactam-binding protein with PASTA domain
MGKVRLIVVTVMAVLFLLPSFAAAQAKPPQGTVPSVEGMPLQKAQQTMVSAGFNAVVTMENVTDQAKNSVVLKQGIPAGKQLPKGTGVPVTVGRYTAPAPVPVPKAEGMKAAAAQQMLTQQGWKVQTNSRPVNDPSQAGSVVQQIPPPGTKVLQNQQPITLTIGQYQAQTTMPSVLGMQLAKAQQTLGAASLNAVVTMENVTDQAKNNVVLKQEVPAGKTLTKGTNVPITVGKYTVPAKVTVPKAVGFPSGSAVQMLQKQGWKVNVERKTVSEAKQNDIVLQQTPAAGTPAVPSQQVVTLTVGSYHAPAAVKGGNVKVLPKSNQTGTLNPPIEPDSVRK